MTPEEYNQELARRIGSFYADPLGFVMFAYPWGQKGTPLEKMPHGPDKWHRELFLSLAEHVVSNLGRLDRGEHFEQWFSAIASGHGVGKSACVAWLIQWIMATRPDTRGTVTANTENQLTTKTWPELAKWHAMSIIKEWFTWTNTQYYYALYPEDKRKNYCITAVPWSPETTEGFAGLHNAGGAVLLIFDEASAIPDKLWEVAEGAMTDGEGFFFAFGNPTRTSGRFYDAFHKNRNLFYTQSVDSRSVRITNKALIDRLIKQYGVDSDVVRYRVRGLFPRGSSNGFIDVAPVEAAAARTLTPDPGAPLVLGIDVARFGDDKSVALFRQGADCRSIPLFAWSGLDTMQLAAKLSDLIDHYKPDLTVIEGAGVGAGVIDALRGRQYKVLEVYPGGSALDDSQFGNQRAEWWSKLRDWLVTGCLPDNRELQDDLTGPEYRFNDKTHKLMLESKIEMKRRGLPSPDFGDALALTFAVKVARRDSKGRRSSGPRIAAGVDTDMVI